MFCGCFLVRNLKCLFGFGVRVSVSRLSRVFLL